MDRRQRKTREAIFGAFTELLGTKSYSKITVNEIIDLADVGRATFYAHFETKDFLLRELCEELFCHVFDAALGYPEKHRHIFDCDAPDSVFLHLFMHLNQNDNRILELLSCESNELFLWYFKNGLTELIGRQTDVFESVRSKKLPRDFWINHVAATFVECVRWWAENKMAQSPEEITEYFLMLI